MEELLTLPVSRAKLRTSCSGVAYGIAAGIVVDTHVSRLSHRLGLTKQKDAVKIENDLVELVPKKDWIIFLASSDLSRTESAQGTAAALCEERAGLRNFALRRLLKTKEGSRRLTPPVEHWLRQPRGKFHSVSGSDIPGQTTLPRYGSASLRCAASLRLCRLAPYEFDGFTAGRRPRDCRKTGDGKASDLPRGWSRLEPHVRSVDCPAMRTKRRCAKATLSEGPKKITLRHNLRSSTGTERFRYIERHSRQVHYQSDHSHSILVLNLQTRSMTLTM